MKQSRFSKTQIVGILKEAETGIPVAELSRKHGFSQSAFYKWKAKYSGIDTSVLRRLKQMYDDLSLEHQALKNIVKKSYKA
jgi:putative transposase